MSVQLYSKKIVMKAYNDSNDQDDPVAIEQYNNRKLTADKIKQILNKVLEKPSSSAKRWVWELVQNAKDVPNQFESVSIQLILSDDKLIFRHNGDPFLLKNIFSLIQQVSSKDSANADEEVTGKFGTGFIATHILSDIIDVKGYVFYKGEYRKFKLRLDRRGDSPEELLPKIDAALDRIRDIENEDIFQIENNYLHKRNEKSHDTQFIYHLTSEEKKKAARKGIQDLVNTLPTTMVFNPKIRRVEVINEIKGAKEIYTCHSNPTNEKIQKFHVEIEDSGTTESRQYFFITYKAENLSLAVAIKNAESLKLDESFGKNPNLYRDFPLIGSEKFYFPYIVDGYKFNPTEDRDGLNLHAHESNEAQLNRQYIEQAVESSVDFSQWLIENGAINRYVCAFSRLPNEKWEENSRKWIEDLQKSWRSQILPLNIFEAASGDCIPLSEAIIPLDGGGSDARLSFYHLCVPILGKGKIPREDLLYNWIDAIGPGSELDSWGHKLDFKLIDLLEVIQGKKSINQLLVDCFQTKEEVINWLNRLYDFLIKQKLTEYLSDFAIIPNETTEGVLHSLNDLKLEDIESPIPDHFLDILKDLGKSWREDLINRGVVLQDQNIEKCNMGDATEAINKVISNEEQNSAGRYEKEFLRRADALPLLVRILQTQDDSSTLNNFRTQVFEKGKNIFKFEEELLTIKGSSVFNHNPALKLFIELIHRKIQEQDNLEGLQAILSRDLSSTIKWLDNYLNLVFGKEDYKRFVEKTGDIIPNRYGALCAYEGIYNYGSEETPLDDQLINILFRLDTAQDWKKILPYDGISIKFSDSKKFEELGGEVEKIVSTIEAEEIKNQGYIFGYKDVLLDLIDWCQNNGNLAHGYMSIIAQRSSTLFFNLTIRGANVDIETIKLIQKEENVAILKAIDGSNVDKDQLKDLIQIASEIGSVKELLVQANQIKEERANFRFLLGIGTQVEEIFKTALEESNLDCEFKHKGSGAYDIEISHPLNGKKYYLELKSYASRSTDPLRFSESQVRTIMENQDNYAVCFLERPSKSDNGNKEVTTSYLRRNTVFKKRMGKVFQQGLNDLEKFKKLNTSESYPRLRIKLLEKIRVEIKKETLIYQSQNFGDLIQDIKDYLNTDSARQVGESVF